MSAAMGSAIGWGVETLLGSALLMALVLLMRGAVRRAFGAPVAYALWALPVLRLVLPPMPVGWRTAATTPVAAVGEQTTVLIGPSAAPFDIAPIAQVAGRAAGLLAGPAGPSLAVTLLALWAVGAVALLGWHAIGYRRFRARVLHGATQVDTIDGIVVIESRAAPGPIAFGVIHRFVAFPTDFVARYDPAERELALAHEIGHHARGDLIANWIALVVLSLHWMSPIAWIAFRAFRSDQEMANDARVLGRAADADADAHAYACAIVKAAHGGAVSAICHLHTIDDLKGRLTMLGRTRASRARTWTGAAGVAVLALAGLGATASGTKAAATVREGVRGGVERVTGVNVAALAPIMAAASVQVEVPAAPATSIAPATVARKAKRVIVVKGDIAKTDEGAEAGAYLAANPVHLPPPPSVPPVMGAIPPTPPTPPVPPESGTSGTRQVTRVIVKRDGRPVTDRTVFVEIPRTVTRDCAPVDGQPTMAGEVLGGRRVMVICRNRIVQVALADVARQSAHVGIERDALRHALDGLRKARAGIAGNPSMPADGRSQALAAIDTSIAEVEGDMARAR